ncbi:MAG: leucyl aminopeptidase family protein [Proteobacteria bacterium]|nr:leucyl aminopeptidase family protein [Pseudomonadota bacterium]
MFDFLITNQDGPTCPILPLTKDAFSEWLSAQPTRVQNWANSQDFKGKAHEVLVIPGEDGNLERAVLGLGDKNTGTSPWAFAGLPKKLPEGDFHIEGDDIDGSALLIGWVLGAYAFDRYKESTNQKNCRLRIPDLAKLAHAKAAAEAHCLVRDLVNTPANDLGPAELADAARALADRFGATCTEIIGEDLLAQNLPAIYEVGKGSDRAPRLIDIHWGSEQDPKVTLVGKGVVFDTGGYNLKPTNGMALMKKDMGGAAHVLGLALMVMEANLRVRLRVLIPAVENSVSGKAFRPSDVINTHKGLTVEIGNTDAEGRLVLCDALSLASEEEPELMLDFATLTGAARVALGPDVAPFFTDGEDIAAGLEAAAAKTSDPLWRLPLWNDYESNLDSKVADLSNDGGGFAGATIAGLYLRRFVAAPEKWVHFDVYAWNPNARPGRPVGGEATGLRASFELIRSRFSN